MANETTQGNLVLEHLQTLGITLLSEWDALVFLYCHPASLGTAAQIARLIGHDQNSVGIALQSLEGRGLIRRSRVFEGRRLYQFSQPQEPGRHSCLLALMSQAQDRAGRVLLLMHLKRPPP